MAYISNELGALTKALKKVNMYYRDYQIQESLGLMKFDGKKIYKWNDETLKYEEVTAK